MSVQKNEIIFFHKESPWPFLVSTARLFLTFGAVLFFYPFFFIDTDFSLMVVSFMSLASKAKPKILYLGGSVLACHGYSQYRQYSFRPIGIGNAKWNPDNYSKETQIIVKELTVHFNNEDKNAIYDTMYAVLGNFDGNFSASYGKVTSVINNILVAYNKDHPHSPITEKEFLELYGFQFIESDLSFLDRTNRGTIMSNVAEILAPQIIMTKKKNALVERALSLQDKVNLSGQNHPEFSIGLFIKNDDLSNSIVIIYDSDFKTTDDLSFRLKLNDLKRILDSSDSATSYNKEIFGMNVIVVASHQEQSSEIIFSPEEVLTIVRFIKNYALNNPIHFEKFDENNENFKFFVSTGKIKYLNESDFPTPRIYRPNEFYKLSHDTEKFEKTQVYRTIQKLNEQRNFVSVKSSSLIEQLPDDDTSS